MANRLEWRAEAAEPVSTCIASFLIYSKRRHDRTTARLPAPFKARRPKLR
jgi:hypothetical protein